MFLFPRFLKEVALFYLSCVVGYAGVVVAKHNVEVVVFPYREVIFLFACKVD